MLTHSDQFHVSDGKNRVVRECLTGKVMGSSYVHTHPEGRGSVMYVLRQESQGTAKRPMCLELSEQREEKEKEVSGGYKPGQVRVDNG